MAKPKTKKLFVVVPMDADPRENNYPSVGYESYTTIEIRDSEEGAVELAKELMEQQSPDTTSVGVFELTRLFVNDVTEVDY